MDTTLFVEKMGLLFEADGMPRIAGRIFGELLLAEEPLCLDALAERLRMSKASASTNARLLERLGALERAAVPGDRRDFYRVAAEMPERMLAIRLERVEKLRTLVAEGVCAAPSPEICERLREIEAFHEAVLDTLGDMLEERRSADSERTRAVAG